MYQMKKILGCVGKPIPWLLALTMLLTVAVIPASADGNGPQTICIPATTDAYIDANSNTVNFGTGPTLLVSNKTGKFQYTLLKFSLSGIPANATITAASLKLYNEAINFYTTPTSRTYNLYGAGNNLTNSTTDPWTDANITWQYRPTADSTVDATASIDSTGFTPHTVIWTSASLKNRVITEYNGNKIISFEIQDSAPVNPDPQTSTATFTSKEGATGVGGNPDNQPYLCVTYTPEETPSACIDGKPLLIDAFFQEAPGTVCLNEPVCFPIVFDITACEDLYNVKVQGGIGGNLTVSNIVGKINGTRADPQPTSKNPGKSTNTLITWLIPHLNAEDGATLTVEVCTGLNPQNKQEFTSSGINPITGNWSASAKDSSGHKVSSYPEYTDRLVVDVQCPCEP